MNDEKDDNENINYVKSFFTNSNKKEDWHNYTTNT